MKFSIVIPTYNHCDDLLKPCIESLQKYTDLSGIEIVVVANGCTDNTKEYVESLGYKLLWFNEPLGYTKATNAGIKAATGEYIILMNNDVQIIDSPKNYWLERLHEPFNHPKMAMTGSLELTEPEIDFDFIVFFCAMIKRNIFEEIGYLDESFSPGYGEDIDFSKRVLEAGYIFKCVDKTTLQGKYHVGTFPLWHQGTQTFKDVKEYGSIVVQKNKQILKERYGTKKGNKMKYSIVIPTYNHCEDLLKPCIDSILKYTDMGEVELIISANGCVDSTKDYLGALGARFKDLGFEQNFKVVWNDAPLGYAKACNVAVKVATADKIVLLNNDILLLEQERSQWLRLLEVQFLKNKKCGVSCIVKGPSEPAGREFAVFFCVMISRQCWNTVGPLNEDYGVGGGEDTEFCIEAENEGFQVCVAVETRWDTAAGMFVGSFPIYHKGEGTMHDKTLVPNHSEIFLLNSLKLAKKYNINWYRWRLSNYWERAVFLKGDPIWPQFPREHNRYTWASQHLVGKKVLEIGCSSGFGTQYLPKDADYTGVDYDKIIVETAKDQGWGDNFKFVNADINKFELDMYDTIIAFEVIEHLDNGMEVVERLKKHCKRLFISTPYMEPPGFWGPHHKLHMLNESHFPGFQYIYCTENGTLRDTPDQTGGINLLLMRMDCNYGQA